MRWIWISPPTRPNSRSRSVGERILRATTLRAKFGARRSIVAIIRSATSSFTASHDLPSGNSGALSKYIVQDLNKSITHAAFALALFQIPFIINFFWSIRHGQKVQSDNPWDATTLDWQTPTPPPHGNFPVQPEVHRGPYDYSLPGSKTDFTPQNVK